MFAALGRFCYVARWPILLASLAFVVASAVFGAGAVDRLKAGGFFDPDAESTKALETLHRELGWDEGTLVVLFTSRDGSTVDEPAYRRAVEAALAGIAGHPGVGTITTVYDGGWPQLVSFDRTSTYAAVGLRGDDDAQVKLVAALRPLLTSQALTVRLGGRPAVYEDLVRQTKRDLENAEKLTFPIVGVLLVIVFGSMVASALPLAIGAIAILGSLLVLQVATGVTEVSLFAINVITLLGFGLAIDYSLFVVARFREELAARDGDVPGALARTMETAGHTVLFSGLTVMISLLSLLVFSPMYIRTMGFGASVAVLMAVLAALTTLPAILAVLGRRVDALSLQALLPGRSRRAAPYEPRGFWYRTSHLVMRHPGAVMLLTLIPLIGVGLPFLRINFAVFDARSLPASHESRAVDDVLRQQFTRNETQPILLVVRTPGSALGPASLDLLSEYTRRVAALPGVRRVDSLVTLDPRLDAAAYAGLSSEAGRAGHPLAARAAERFARGEHTLVSVLYDDEPYSVASQELVRAIRRLDVPAGLSVQAGGEPPYLVDFLGSLADRTPLALTLVVGAMFVVLFLMLGSLVLPLKAVVLTILSLSFSFGALVWVFQDGHLSDLLGFTSVGSIDGSMPVLVFAAVFGLSMDYEVFLLSRIKEHYDRTGEMASAVAQGLQKTGQIITSAALLLVVVTGSFATGEAAGIKQIGVCLGLAILVDATIVRALLVPASMRLMNAYNWWAPAPLAALHRRIGLGGPA